MNRKQQIPDMLFGLFRRVKDAEAAIIDTKTFQYRKGCCSSGLMIIPMLILTACGPQPVQTQAAPTQVTPAPLEQCRTSATGVLGTVQWLLIGTGVKANSQCQADELVSSIATCLGQPNVGELSDPATRERVRDCIKGTYPDAIIVGGYVGGGGSLTIQATRGGGGKSSPTCSSGPLVEESLANPVGDTVFELGRAIFIFGPYTDAFQEYFEAREEAALNGESTTPRFEKAKENLRLVTEAVMAAEEGTPGGLSVAEQAKYAVESLVNWLFADDDESDEEERNEGESEQPDPNAESACDAINQFFNECNLVSWTTAPCQLMRDKMNNPDCNPMVALTDGDRACQKETFTVEALQSAVLEAEVRCWSLVNPGTDGVEMCAASLSQGPVVYTESIVGDACNDPRAMFIEGSCLRSIDPQEAMEAIVSSLGGWQNILDIITDQHSPPGIGPEPEPGPLPK